MKIMVIGRSGQLGRSLTEAVLRPDVSLISVGRPQCDIRQQASVAASIDTAAPDLVVNAAAYTAVDGAEAAQEEAFAVNADGPFHIGAACAVRGVPMIHISTDYVYDGSKSSPYVETDAAAPLNVYGRSKLAGEERLAEVQPQHVIIRSAWVHSPFGDNFTKTMLQLAQAQPTIRIVDDQIGNPTYAPHLADAVLAIAARIAGGSDVWDEWGIYHVAATGATSWFGLAREIFSIAAAAGRPTPEFEAIGTADFPTAAARPANSRLDTSKLHAVFGLKLPHWTDGVAAGVERLIAGANGAAPPGTMSAAGRR